MISYIYYTSSDHIKDILKTLVHDEFNKTATKIETQRASSWLVWEPIYKMTTCSLSNESFIQTEKFHFQSSKISLPLNFSGSFNDVRLMILLVTYFPALLHKMIIKVGKEKQSYYLK